MLFEPDGALLPMLVLGHPRQAHRRKWNSDCQSGRRPVRLSSMLRPPRSASTFFVSAQTSSVCGGGHFGSGDLTEVRDDTSRSSTTFSQNPNDDVSRLTTLSIACYVEEQCCYAFKDVPLLRRLRSPGAFLLNPDASRLSQLTQPRNRPPTAHTVATRPNRQHRFTLPFAKP